jgi:6-phosphogluconolactonase
MRKNAVRAARWVGMLLAVAALVIPAVTLAASKPAKKKTPGVPHRVYTATNDPSGNHVIMYTRRTNGSLALLGSVATGGKGSKSEPPFGFPIVDTSGSIDLTSNGKLLFVVNAGSNTVTSFLVTANGLKRESVASSHGKLPTTLAHSGNVLYVANGISNSIFGWHFSSTGKLTPIAGSNRKLTGATPAGKKDKPGVVSGSGFSSDGGVFIVAMRGLPRKYGEIDTFLISRNGAAAPSHATATPGIDNPFGLAALKKNILVSNAGYVATPSGVQPNPGDFTQFTGSVASYKLSPTGKLTLIKDTKTGGRAACWVIIGKDGKTAYAVNTLSNKMPTSGDGAVSSLHIAPNGALTLQKQANTGPGFPSDEGTSHDGKYLYVVDASIILSAPPPNGMNLKSHIEIYRVGPGGTMTRLTPTPNTLTPALSGIGVY